MNPYYERLAKSFTDRVKRSQWPYHFLKVGLLRTLPSHPSNELPRMFPEGDESVLRLGKLIHGMATVRACVFWNESLLHYRSGEFDQHRRFPYLGAYRMLLRSNDVGTDPIEALLEGSLRKESHFDLLREASKFGPVQCIRKDDADLALRAYMAQCRVDWVRRFGEELINPTQEYVLAKVHATRSWLHVQRRAGKVDEELYQDKLLRISDLERFGTGLTFEPIEENGMEEVFAMIDGLFSSVQVIVEARPRSMYAMAS